MQKLARLLKESVAFTLTREHWANSITLIVITVILLIAGNELDRVFDSTDFSTATRLINLYLTIVVFSIAWYRGVITTGKVEIEYRFTRRSWLFIVGSIKLTLIVILFVVPAVILVIVFNGSDFSKIPDPESFISWIGILIVLLPLIYLLIRLEFILAAAANDRSMTLGEAWDSSRAVQWPLVGTVMIVQGVGALAGNLLPDPEDLSMAPMAYLIEALDMIWSLIVQAFAIAATGMAYKQVQQSADFS